MSVVKSPRPTGRQLKNKAFELLKSTDFSTALNELCRMPARQVINPLFSFLYNTDDQIKWRAVTAMGAVVARLADEDMEAARVIMRRFMWNLNDESGGIGWGSPEAMGEILACHEALAEEYVHILISYARKDGNYLELEALQRGLLWGIERLSQVRPHLVRDSVDQIVPYLESKDPAVRGISACIMGMLQVREARGSLEALVDDNAGFDVYHDRKLIRRCVKDVARAALEKLTVQEER